MQIILSDHNCEGQAQAIFDILQRYGDWHWCQSSYAGFAMLICL